MCGSAAGRPLSAPIDLTVTLDRAAGTAQLAAGGWSETIPLGLLRARLGFYRGLWSRGSKTKGGPGPWAAQYEQRVQALTAALREIEGR